MNFPLIDLSRFSDCLSQYAPPTGASPTIQPRIKVDTEREWEDFFASWRLSQRIITLIREGVEVGERSKAMMTVLCALAAARASDSEIIEIFEEFAIGEKYREKRSKEEWLKPQIDKARARVAKPTVEDVLKQLGLLFQEKKLTAKGALRIMHKAELDSLEIDQALHCLSSYGFGTLPVLKAAWKSQKKELDVQAKRQQKEKVIKQASEKKKIINWDPCNYSLMLLLIEERLREEVDGLPYLRYAGLLSYVVTRKPTGSHAIDALDGTPPDVPCIIRYTCNSIVLRIESGISFILFEEEGPKQISVPKELFGLLQDNPNSRAPEVIGLATHPVLSPSGEYICKEGCDSVTRLFSHYGGVEFLPLETGGQDEAKNAVASIIDNMYADFDWEDSKIDPISAVALFLTTLLRKTLDIAPGWLVKANLQGSGKTTLVRIVHIIATGFDLPVSSFSEDPQEARKAMLAILLESPALICYDNIPDGFEVRSPVIAQVLTIPVFKDRILNFSQQVSVPTNTVIVLTGNNVTLDADLSRRIVPVNLQPKELMPEKRSFRHKDIVGWSRSIRVEMIQKALSVVSMYFQAGCPLSDQGLSGSGFPLWDKMVRFPLFWATGVDIVDSVDKARQSSSDIVSRISAIAALAAAFPSPMKFTATDVFRVIQDANDGPANDLKDAFMELGAKTAKNSSSVGWALRRLLNVPSAHGSLRRNAERNMSRYYIELSSQP